MGLQLYHDSLQEEIAYISLHHSFPLINILVAYIHTYIYTCTYIITDLEYIN